MTTKEAVALLERYSNYDGMGIPNLAGCKEAMRVAVDALKESCPELKESEDERIRKYFIWIVKNVLNNIQGLKLSEEQTRELIDNYSGIKESDMIAWLKKQKEKEKYDRMQPVYNNLDSFESALAKAWKAYNDSGARTVDGCEDDYVECAHAKGFREGFLYGLEKQKEPHYTKRNALFDKCVENCDPEVMKSVSDRIDEMLEKEQKPAEWSEDYREEDIQTRFAFYTYKDELGTLYLSNVFVEESSRNHGFGTKILRAAEKVAETIGATTICLKVKQDSPANAWYRKNGYGYVAFEDGYDWLEKNLEYMKPNKQEWSVEDEIMLKWIEDILLIADSDLYDKLNGKVSPITDSAYSSMKLCIAKCLSWLKSLYPSWKPSAQELGALKTAVSVLTEERTFPKAAEQIQKIIYVFDGKELRKDWKPSEEQMSMLLAVINEPCNAGAESCQLALRNLYQDLKKL